jgi:hypothetical protein
MKYLRKILAISLMMLLTLATLSCRDTKNNNDQMDGDHMEHSDNNMMDDNN